MSYSKKVNTRSRKSMIDFLSGHFRYNTMNSWNNATSYAHNMKIYNLPVENSNKLYELLGCEEAYFPINDLIEDWNREYDYKYQAYFNGRSGGYLVFCEGGVETSRREVNGEVKIDRRIYAYSGKGIDRGEDYLDWSMEGLRDRVKLVQSFDKLADDIVEEVKYLVEHYVVEDEDYNVVKTRKVLKEIEVA